MANITAACHEPNVSAVYQQWGNNLTARIFLPHSRNKDTTQLNQLSPPIEDLLRDPSWSVRSLLAPPTPSSTTPPTKGSESISRQKLHHLLRLSALPPPALDSAEEKSMLDTLHQQLHFVRSMQAIDTTGVEPLVAIREETNAVDEERTVGLSDAKILKRLQEEKIVGRRRRPRWVSGGRGGDAKEEETMKGEGIDWDPLGMAEKKVGRYFVVDSSPADVVSTPEAAVGDKEAVAEDAESTKKKTSSPGITEEATEEIMGTLRRLEQAIKLTEATAGRKGAGAASHGARESKAIGIEERGVPVESKETKEK